MYQKCMDRMKFEVLPSLPFIPILSIGGGGIKGIMEAVFLEFLESMLQILDGPEVRLADYFRMIAGTSTGGLIAAMLTCRNESGRPLFTTKQIVEFYHEEGPKIFPQSRIGNCCLGRCLDVIKCLRGPKYNGRYLRSVIREKLGENKLCDTLTNVMIVAYDVGLQETRIFSSHENTSGDVLLSDACIGTSAAPIYLPSHYFQDSNFIDGGVAANDPILLAIMEGVTKETGGTKNMTEAAKRGQFFILSVVTGSKCEGYSARETSKWGAFDWMYKGGKSPLFNTCDRASESVVKNLLPMHIETLDAQKYYFRCEVDDLPEDLSSMDIATPKILEGMEKFAKEWLMKPISESNREETPANALMRMAVLLSKDRTRRLAGNPM